MTMYMPLVASEDGVVQLMKQPGVSLEPGDILGILTLDSDDPARVKHAKPFEGQLPTMGIPGVVGNKPRQQLTRCLTVLRGILDGYDNQAIMSSTLKDLVDVLREKDLPYSEITAILSSLSGHIPSKLEDSVRSAIDIAKAKRDNQEFPAMRIKKILEHYLQDNVSPQERTMLRSSLAELFEALDRYQNGLKGHEMVTIASLLELYERTEKLFGGSIEARVLALQEQNKDDLEKVASLVLSHIKAQSKAKLVLALLDYMWNQCF
jgi:acetyl-CoA carboxylase / biotin carboxylase 1